MPWPMADGQAEYGDQGHRHQKLGMLCGRDRFHLHQGTHIVLPGHHERAIDAQVGQDGGCHDQPPALRAAGLEPQAPVLEPAQCLAQRFQGAPAARAEHVQQGSQTVADGEPEAGQCALEGGGPRDQ
ncbi:hypothetical protein GCM10023166_34130 [Paeniglutamicibacter cryotolerans]